MKKQEIKFNKHAKICDEIKEVYRKKNADYGDSVGELYDRLGDITILTRISDKYNRLMSLLDPNKVGEPNYESIDDTILDMANYSIIWLMERSLKEESKVKPDTAANDIPVWSGDVTRFSKIYTRESMSDQIANRNKQLKINIADDEANINDLIARPADVTKLMNDVETVGTSLNHARTILSETNNMENGGLK